MAVFDLYELSRIIRDSDSNARQQLKTTLLDLTDEDAKTDLVTKAQLEALREISTLLVNICDKLEEIKRALEDK